MRVLHVTPTFYPAIRWGGPIFSTYNLCNALHDIGNVSLKVLTTNSAGPDRGHNLTENDIRRTTPPYNIRYCNRFAGHSISFELLRLLRKKIQWSDLVHLTAVYSFPTIPTLLLARMLKKPVVWTPRGALQRWQGTTKPLLKRYWERICRTIATPRTCCIHVTSSMEEISSKIILPDFSFKVIANGIKIPEIYSAHRPRRTNRLRLMYIGRIHPIKGIENLVAGLGLLKDLNYRLTICGNGKAAYIDAIKALCTKSGIDDRVRFVGHLPEHERNKMLVDSDVCVVPSHTENFGMVVAEALACGVPVICSKGAPWSGLVEHRCGMWVDNSPRSLAKAVREISTMELGEMGRRGRHWMACEFDWLKIAKNMSDLYRNLIAKQVP